MPIKRLIEDPRNARLHDDRNLEAIAQSLRIHGQMTPIVVQSDGMIVRKGSGTLAAARDLLGWTHIAAVIVERDPLSMTAYAIADNRTSDLSQWDLDRLTELIAELPDDIAAGAIVTDDDLAELLQEAREAAGEPEAVEGLSDPDDMPEPPDDPVTKRGDLIVMGQHRLLCGDSSSESDVDRLLSHGRDARATIDLVNTDPPYNVKVEPRSNNAIAAGNSSRSATDAKMHHQRFDFARHPEKAKGTHKQIRAKDRPLENDSVASEAFNKMLLAWFGNAARVLKPGGSFYIWGARNNLGNFPGPLKACGLYFSQMIVWDKQHPVLTRKDYMGAVEICFYGWKQGAGHNFFGPNNATDLWHVKKVHPQSMVHLTEKPVELEVRAIQYSSRPGESVLDLFGGSGSTLIACEQTGRRAFLMEIDPAYCDVIVERWENFTGKSAERLQRVDEPAA